MLFRSGLVEWCDIIILRCINVEELKERIDKIEKRNKNVELDKAWETSWTRRICIMILTYIVVVIYSYVIKKYDNILLSSLVPVIGFTLSTLSMSIVRKFWEIKIIHR